MGSGTDNIEDLMDTESVFFTLEGLAKFYTEAAVEGAETWLYDIYYGWHDVSGGQGPHTLSDPRHWEVRRPEKWYDNIPKEGIICWVWDSHEVIKTLQVIHEYQPENTWPFVDSNYDCWWQHAEPVLPEECYQP